MEQNNNNAGAGIDLSQLTPEQKAMLMGQLVKEQEDEKNKKIARREAYEALRDGFLAEVQKRLEETMNGVVGFKKWLEGESTGFSNIMREYGQVVRDTQQSFSINNGSFKLEVSFNKVKAFDERANIAADRLIEYLRNYMQNSAKGEDDPMYNLAMTLLERNKQGDLDYKSISKLYELEDKFDDEYRDIMALFKESNMVSDTATYYYFHQRNQQTGAWTRIEPSFCRL